MRPLFVFDRCSRGGTLHRSAAAVGAVSHLPVHRVCGLSGYYDARIPPFTHVAPVARAAASAILHPAREPRLILLTYGHSDSRSAARAQSYAGVLRGVGHTVEVRAYPGGHQWAEWHSALLACFRLLDPSH